MRSTPGARGALREGRAVPQLDFKGDLKLIALGRRAQALLLLPMDGWRLAHRAQPVGATASPLIRCRVAALVARAAAFAIGPQEGDVITNVDGPVLVLEGALASRASAATRTLLLWCVLGAPLCRKKGR